MNIKVKQIILFMVLNLILVPLASLDNFDIKVALAEKGGVADSTMMTLYNEGYVKFRVSDPVRSIIYAKKLGQMQEEQGELREKYYRYAEIGQLYHKLGMHHLALEYLIEASSFFLKTDEDIGLAWLYSDIGNVYFSIFQYDLAESYYVDGLELMKRVDSEYGQSVMLNNIALCQIKEGNIEEAFENFYQALEIRKKINHKFATLHSKFLLAENYSIIGDDEQATKLFREIWDKNDYDGEYLDDVEILRAKAGLALFNVSLLLKDYSKAEDYLEKSISLIRKVGDYYTLGSALAMKAKYYDDKSRTTEALTIYVDIFDYAIDHNFLTNAHGYAKELVRLNYKENNLAESAKYFDIYVALSDSLLNYRSTENLVQLHSIVQNHIKEVENENLKQQNIYSNRVIILSFVFFFIVLLMISYVYLKGKWDFQKILKLANASSEGIVIHDRGAIIDCNNQFLKMFGGTNKRFYGLNLIELSVKESKDDFHNLLYANETKMIDTKMLASDGKIIDVKISSRPYRYRRKEVRVAVIQDITMVNKYINSLIETQQQLKVLNATKDRLFSIIGHDLKNPFNAIIGFSNLMKESWKQLDPNDIDEMLNMINDSSVSAHTLLENLLDWARVQTERQKFNPQSLKVGDLIDETLALLSTSLKFKEINVEVKSNDNLFVYADQRMLSTVIRNLLTNAIKFTPNKGLITVSTTETSDATRISIADNGMGMGKEYLENIFQIDKIHSQYGTNNEKGTGLGLILCNELAEYHNGHILVESSLGKGSKFTVCFPKKIEKPEL